MNVENIITVLLSATIPSVITYLITKKNVILKWNQLKFQHKQK